MSSAPEAAQADRELERKHPDSAAKDTPFQDISLHPLGGVFGSWGADGSEEANSKIASSPILQRRANGEMRAVLMRRVQQSAGNYKTQQLVAQLRRSSIVQRACACGGTCESCQEKGAQEKGVEEEESTVLQRSESAASSTGDSADAGIVPSDSASEPLPLETRRFMEPRFASDFSDVRVHTDSRAAQSAGALAADAYTTGRDIYFAAGKYAPSSREGQHLLAHELTHTVQQDEGRVPQNAVAMQVADGVIIGHPNDPLEHEAETQADRASHPQQEATPITPDSSGAVRRAGWNSLKDNPITNAIGEGVSAVGTGIKAGIQKGKEFVVGQVEKLAPGAIKFFRNIRDYFRTAISKGVDGLFGGIISSIREKGIGATLADLVGTFASGAFEAVGGFAAGSCAAIGKLAEYLIDLHVKLGAAAFAELKKGFQAAGGALEAFWTEYEAPGIELVKKKLAAVWTDVQKLVGGIWDALKPLREAAGEVWEAVTDFLAEGKRSFDAWMDWLVGKALDAWEELKAKLKPVMGKVKTVAKVIGIILLLLPPQGVIVVLGALVYGLYLGAKALWDKWGKKFTHDVREWWVTSGLPAVEAKLKEFQSKIDSVKESLAGALSQVYEAVMGVLGDLGVLSFLQSVKEAIDGFAKKVQSSKDALVKKLEEWSAKVKALLASADPYIQKFKEGLRQTLLVVTLGPLALLDDGVWSTVGKVVQFAMTTPCLRELGGLMRVPALLEMIGKARTFMKKAWDLILHPGPIIEAIKAAFGRMIAKVPGAVKTAVNTLLPAGDARLVQGVWSYLEPQIAGLLENWWPILKGMFWDILWPWPKLSDEVVKFWHSGKESVDLLFDLEINRAADKALEAFRTFNSILGLAYGWFFLASVLIGALIGGIPTAGAGFGAGAVAGAAFAGQAGEALLALAIAAETGTIRKALLDYRVLNRHLANEGDREPADEIAFENIANSVFSLTLMSVMIEVGELAVDFLGAVFKWIKGKVKGEAPKGEAPKAAEGEEPKAEGEKGKNEGKQPTPDELKRSNESARAALENPGNIRPVEAPAFKDEFDVEVDAGDDHIYRHEKEEPSWCRFGSKTCPIDLGPAAEAAAEAAVGKGPRPLYEPGATAEQVAAFIEATAKRLGRSPAEVGRFLRLANQMGGDAETLARAIADSMNNGKPVSRELRAQLDEMLNRLRNPKKAVDRDLGAEANKQYVDPITGKPLEPGTPEHRAQRWAEYQQREGLTPEEAAAAKAKWDAQYDVAIENQKVGGKAENAALTKADAPKNNTPLVDPAHPSEAFIPDGIKNKPAKLEYGKPYDFVEVKYWDYLSQTGNVIKMIEYIQKFGGSLELWLRGGDEATELSEPLRKTINDLNRAKPGTVRFRRFTI
jgi:hypothetical protein